MPDYMCLAIMHYSAAAICVGSDRYRRAETPSVTGNVIDSAYLLALNPTQDGKKSRAMPTEITYAGCGTEEARRTDGVARAHEPGPCLD